MKALERSWTLVRVADMATLENGFPFPSSDFASEGCFPLIRIRDLSATEFDTYVSTNVPRRVVLRNGDLVIAMDGDFNVIRWRRGPAALNQRLCLLRSREGHDLRFVEYALPDHLNRLRDTQFVTTVAHLSSAEILGVRLPAPPPDEQRRIADFLDDQVARIDAAIALRSVSQDLSRQAFLAEVRARTSPLLNGPDRLVQLRRLLAGLCTGGTPNEDIEQGNLAWYTPASFLGASTLGAPVRELARNTAGRQRPVIFAADSVLVVGIGATAGRVAFLDHEASGNQQLTALSCGTHLIPRFLLWQLYGRQQELRATAPFTTLPILNNDFLRSTLIRVKSVAAQRRDVEALDAAADRLSSLKLWTERHAQLLRERRQALITAAVTGQFDVSSAGRRAAAAVTA